MWVDTSVVIEMAQAKNDVSQNDIAHKRGIDLYNKLQNLTTKGSIIYLDAQQRDEYGNNPKLFNEIDDLHIQLSQGIRIQHEVITKQYQIQRMMKVYCGNSNKFELMDDDIFSNDPANILEQSKKLGMFVTVKRKILEEERNENRRVRDNIISGWENIRLNRKARKISYKQALKEEYAGEWLAIRNVLRKRLNQKMQNTNLLEEDFMTFLGESHTLSPIDWWRIETHKSSDLESLKNFYLSEAFKLIPYIEIKSKLLAYLITIDGPVKRGDYGDSEHLSQILPYADLIITDSAMKHRVNELGLATKYNTDIMSLKEFDKIMESLDKLSQI